MDFKVLPGPNQLTKLGEIFFDPPNPLFGGPKIGIPRISDFQPKSTVLSHKWPPNSLIMVIMVCKVVTKPCILKKKIVKIKNTATRGHLHAAIRQKLKN